MDATLIEDLLVENYEKLFRNLKLLKDTLDELEQTIAGLQEYRNSELKLKYEMRAMHQIMGIAYEETASDFMTHMEDYYGD